MTEKDLIYIKDISSINEFNEHAKHISNMIAISYLKSNRVDYEMHELFVIKMFMKRKSMDASTPYTHCAYETMLNQFISWVFMAIQDLGGTDEQADTYEKNFKTLLKPNFNKNEVQADLN